ncbi:MAG: gamma-glutamyl-gamma-aminobutyrate hydrolase family protein [Actinomycetota bacterium]|nr:gamma-glutamyl-gamma-aminobutyrate hydrolase family protein [Actinomycetota bacterium]
MSEPIEPTERQAPRRLLSEHPPPVSSPDARPLIAVTTSEIRDSKAVTPTPEGEPPRHEMALGLKYLYAIEAAGGVPVVVPPLRAASLHPLLGRVSGVCLSGGPDLDPESYGERRHARTGPVESQLDAFELAFARAADARGLPILAVCRGLQLLNVARGGTLHQHLPDVVGEGVSHRQHEAGAKSTHWVTLAPSSRLSQILLRRRTKVNSFHHQSIATLGAGLTVTSRASDGTVESVEAVDRDFVIGVQWHAECLVERTGQAALFRAFVDMARRFDEAPARSDRVDRELQSISAPTGRPAMNGARDGSLVGA